MEEFYDDTSLEYSNDSSDISDSSSDSLDYVTENDADSIEINDAEGYASDDINNTGNDLPVLELDDCPDNTDIETECMEDEEIESIAESFDPEEWITDNDDYIEEIGAVGCDIPVLSKDEELNQTDIETDQYKMIENIEDTQSILSKDSGDLSSIEDDETYEKTQDILTREETTRLWKAGLHAIDDTVDMMREDLRDKGMEDGPEIESVVMQYRKSSMEKLSRELEHKSLRSEDNEIQSESFEKMDDTPEKDKTAEPGDNEKIDDSIYNDTNKRLSNMEEEIVYPGGDIPVSPVGDESDEELDNTGIETEATDTQGPELLTDTVDSDVEDEYTEGEEDPGNDMDQAETTDDIKNTDNIPDDYFDYDENNLPAEDEEVAENSGDMTSAENNNETEEETYYHQGNKTYDDMNEMDVSTDQDGISEQEKSEIIKDFADQNVSASVLPKNNGHWEGEEGDSRWIPDENVAITWKKGGEVYQETYKEIMARYGIDGGIEYNNKEPDFSNLEDSLIRHVELEEFSGERRGIDGTYSKAEMVAAKRLSNETGELWTPQRVQEYMKDHGLTWHECADRKTVRAVPTEINAAFKHTGGIGVEKSLDAAAKVLDNRYRIGRGFSLHREGPVISEGYVRKEELDAAIRDNRKAFREAKRKK